MTKLMLGTLHTSLVSFNNLNQNSFDIYLFIFSFLVAPPPPEFSDIVSNTRSLHIPTQPNQMMRQHPPSHYMMQQQQMQYHMMHQQQQQQQRSVRIVGALPKQSVQPQPQPSQVGKMGHHHIHHFHSHTHHQHH